MFLNLRMAKKYNLLIFCSNTKGKDNIAKYISLSLITKQKSLHENNFEIIIVSLLI